MIPRLGQMLENAEHDDHIERRLEQSRDLFERPEVNRMTALPSLLHQFRKNFRAADFVTLLASPIKELSISKPDLDHASPRGNLRTPQLDRKLLNGIDAAWGTRPPLPLGIVFVQRFGREVADFGFFRGAVSGD